MASRVSPMESALPMKSIPPEVPKLEEEEKLAVVRQYHEEARTVDDFGASAGQTNEDIAWIRKNIKKRECVCFIQKPDLISDDPVCFCGYQKSDHKSLDKTKMASVRPTDTWTKDDHTKTSKTDAFGEIEFSGFGDKVSKYCRVDVDSDTETIVELMVNKWRLVKPNLLISVTGGASTFHLKTKLKDAFKRGLMKAALSTGAWIITGGTNAGVMKHVGEAVRDFGLTAKNQGQVIAIGIATWGIIQNRQELVDEKGKWPASYKITKEQNKKESFLDPNHSHFILVDNGTQHQYAVEIPLRAKLESKIANMKTDTGQDAVTVPVCMLVLEGGPGTLETCSSAVAKGTPAVIIKGSGRAADILAYAYQNSKEMEVEVTDKEGRVHKQSQTVIDTALELEITEKVKAEFTESELSRRVGWVRQCLHNRDLLTVFELDSRNSASDVDMAILKALLKANKNEVMDQLKLALAWNRIDIAKSDIFTEERLWLPGSLDDVMLSAIQLNRADFVDLFLDHGIILKDFLTPRRLLSLYNNINQKSVQYSLLSKLKSRKTRVNFNLEDVGLLIQDLLGDYYQPYYLTNSSFRYLDADIVLGDKTSTDVTATGGLMQTAHMIGNAGTAAIDPRMVADSTEFFHRPAQELFIWAVLLNRQSLAKLFWREGNEQIAGALVANALLNALKRHTDDAEQINSFTKDAVEFESLAIGILNFCYNTDERRAQELLIRELANWGCTTSVLIAVQADNKRFVSQTACQNLLNNIWMGQMSHDNNIIALLSSIVFPPMIFLTIKFRCEEKAKQDALIQSVADAKATVNKRAPSAHSTRHIELNRQETTVNEKETELEFHGPQKLTPLQKLKLFYTAPVIIFYLNVISYLLFLMLYSYILLVQFRSAFSIYEGVLIGWVFTIFVEEIRQVFMGTATSLRSKIASYFTDSWNILDVITLVLFTVGMILRFIPGDNFLEAARVILALNLVSFFLRILHIFSVNKQLGPKLVMIRRMLEDLLSFVIILMVFILAYAIASEAILYPNTPFDPYLLFYTIRKAYWTVYGELFLNELEAVDGVECTSDPLLYADHKAVRCPSTVGRYLVPVLMGIYILLTNVLLLNLLIAMFSYTFQKIQDKTNDYWNYHRFLLVVEYHSRPPLPPPFIIFTHLWQFFKYTICRCCCLLTEQSSDLRKKFDNKLEEKQLVQWENVIADNYRSNEEQAEYQSVEHQVKMSISRLDNVMVKIDELQEIQSNGQSLSMSRQSGMMNISPVVDRRLGALEDQMMHTYKALNWIMQSLSDSQLGTKPPMLPDLQKQRNKDQQEKEKQALEEKRLVQMLREKRIESHFKSRQQIYPGSTIHRFPVPDEKVLWEISFPEYDPVRYTSDFIINKSWADPLDLLALPQKERSQITFNAYDTRFNVNRKSNLDKGYQVKDGLPLNPIGRTGLIGRGVLGRWGPNHAGDPVVTRWKLDSSGNKVLQDNKPMLEFVAVKRSDNKEWAIPGGICEPGENAWNVLRTDFTEESLGSLMDDPEEKKRIEDKLNTLSKSGDLVFKGYADDPRNTDNAWLETHVFSYHDEDGSILQHFILRAGDDTLMATWQTMSTTMTMYGGHSYYLSLVAKKLDAAF
ncbi:transient receptor potential cation channel subfamily M member-like 2 [Gigantopelta aegis]|uniref:transient receptor potential cation channel subfamily M member-like 2 n=1 Tax=Gigantopelta aegis TaxID=1735272 RepID=UPI001B88A20A|nr:transient receptor potential cation channel subfamily M member-like 2 [Gigantopelta aegis]